jgi:hypothetical protein
MLFTLILRANEVARSSVQSRRQAVDGQMPVNASVRGVGRYVREIDAAICRAAGTLPPPGPPSAAWFSIGSVSLLGTARAFHIATRFAIAVVSVGNHP